MEKSLNPFKAEQKQNTEIQASASREVSEVQSMMIVAKRFPRDPVEAMDRILQSCARPGLAEHALYQYARGGTNIEGPSIRLAEAIAQGWGNCQSGWREIGRGREGEHGYSDVEAFAWDMESNVRKAIVFRVAHVRDTRKGSYALNDARDVYELVSNQASRRVRNCILAIIPGDVSEAAVHQCQVTMNSNADTSAEGIKRMVEAFSQFGITKPQIEKRIQRRLDTMSPALMTQLKKIYASLRDGMSQPSDWFDVETESEQAADLNEKLQGTKQEGKAKES
jgi:hypothetical protein